MKGCIIISKASVTSLNLAKLIAKFASDKKAEDITILDMREVVNFCDFFVICTGNSNRQVRAIADGIDDGLEELGSKLRYKQGLKSCDWVLLDLGVVIAHVFEREMRDFYGLEYLWQEAKKIQWEE